MFWPEDYTLAAYLLPRFLGFVYFFAFGAFIFQIKGLIGSKGILPVDNFLVWVRRRFPRQYFNIIPSVFWWNCSDRALLAVVYTGTALSFLLMLGVYPPLILAILYILYLSIISVGQDFLGFGWEGFLLEITINTFLVSLSVIPNLMVWISINLLLFRFHLQAGAVKLQSRDPNWRNLTAIAYHYESQPIPNMLAWYVHKLPLWFHKFSTWLMFFVELVVAFGIFGPDLMRLGVFFAFVGLQWSIWVTGNFSYLNHLTAALCIILVANPYLSWLPIEVNPTSPPLAINIFCGVAGGILTLLQLGQLWHHFFPNYRIAGILNKISSYHIVNRYGIFAVMTTVRQEIVFEGSYDGIEWKEYFFRHKPSEITRRPKRISPYQPRIDWQAWFLPFGSYRHDAWFTSFMFHLLLGTPEVLKLIKTNPFPGKPPKYVRTLIYNYTFSTPKEKKELGWWWRRELVGQFSRTMHLETK